MYIMSGNIITFYDIGAPPKSGIRTVIPEGGHRDTDTISGMDQDALRLRGNANNGNCSPRNLNANNAASNTNQNYSGSAQTLHGNRVVVPDSSDLGMVAGIKDNVVSVWSENYKPEAANSLVNFKDPVGSNPKQEGLNYDGSLPELTIELIESAIHNTIKGHRSKPSVRKLEKNVRGNAESILRDLYSGEWYSGIHYRYLEKTNNNGKTRHINSPSLYTRILQHLFILLVQPLYDAQDPMIGLNCKKGAGINSKIPEKSVMKRMKHIYYDQRQYDYGVVIDQRKCYDHIKVKTFRKSLKLLTRNKWLIDFGVSIVFCPGGRIFPVGTPTSPLAHHIVMLRFDLWLKRYYPGSVRYADDVFIPVHDSKEGQEAKWRIKNFWWYELGIRAKSQTSRVIPLSIPLDFCGYIFHRVPEKTVTSHNKGWVTLRGYTLRAAIKATSPESIAAYKGIIMNTDIYSQLSMDLQRITETIKIDRGLRDYQEIDPKQLAKDGVVFDVLEYYITEEKKDHPYLILIIGIKDSASRIEVYRISGSFSSLIEFLKACEESFKDKSFLPITNAVLEDFHGLIFKNSINVKRYA